MANIQFAGVIFLCVFGGAMCGMFLFCKVIPAHHMEGNTRDLIEHVMGLIGTLSVLVLGLSIATAKEMYDRHDAAIKEVTVKILMLDHLLARYGTDTDDIRRLLYRSIKLRRDIIWSQEKDEQTFLNQPDVVKLDQLVEHKLLELAPKSEMQKSAQGRILSLADEVEQIRWMVLGSVSSSVPTAFFVIWLVCLFTTFGLIVPHNGTMMVKLLCCSMVVASSLFLIAELDDPYRGCIRLNGSAFDFALSQLRA